MGMLAGMLAGAVNALVTVGFGLPAFIATLGMYYIARGLAAWLVAGQQLTGWPESFNLLGRKVGDILDYLDLPPPPGFLRAVTDVVSVQTVWLVAGRARSRAWSSATRSSASRSTPPAATAAPPTMPASTPAACG